MSRTLSQEDYDFFLKVFSLYRAVTLSATSPVVVPAFGTSKVSAFSHMFYDCTENPLEGKAIMKGRIAIAQGDIRKHHGLHRRMLQGFNDLEEALNVNNRKRISVDVTEEISHKVQEYVELVKDHQARLGGLAFLQYPVCISGHYFQVPETPFINSCEFNSSQDYQGALMELSALESQLPDFEARQDTLSGFRLANAEDTGEGFYDGSLRGRMALSEELLVRAGLEID